MLFWVILRRNMALKAGLGAAIVMLIAFAVLEVVAVIIEEDYTSSEAWHTYKAWIIVSLTGSAISFVFAWLVDTFTKGVKGHTRRIIFAIIFALALFQMYLIISQYGDYWHDKGTAMIILGGPWLSLLLVLIFRDKISNPKLGRSK